MCRSLVTLTFCLLSAGCYTMHPAAAPLSSGNSVVLAINDEGRIALRSVAGAEIAQLHGRFVEASNSEYVVAVRGITYLGGREQRWTGERLRVQDSYVSARYERRFSRGRSVILGTAVVGGFALFLATRDLLGIGGRDRTPPDSHPLPGELTPRPRFGHP